MREKLKRSDVIFDNFQLKTIKASLSTLTEKSTQGAHNAHIKEAKRVLSGNVCPWCRAELVKRDGKYDPFMDCSSYPNCRFTRSP